MTAAAGPVYIGGLDRTGKTTLAGFLSSHPAIAIPPAGTNMWTYFSGRFGDLGHRDNLDRCLAAMLAYGHVRALDPDPERIRGEFAAGPASYARLFDLFLRHFAERAGKPRWGAQTGLVERYADDLVTAYPGVRIIHMIRDPRDRYAAARERSPGAKGRAGAAAARWNYSVRLARRHLARHPEQYLVVCYEDLVRETAVTLRRVCAFLGEPFVPAMLAMDGVPERRERLRSGAIRPGSDLLSAEHIGSYRGRIPPEELAFLQLHTARGMRAHGYRPEALGWPPRDWLTFAVRHWPAEIARSGAWRGLEALQQQFPALVPRRPDPRTLVPATGGATR